MLSYDIFISLGPKTSAGPTHYAELYIKTVDLYLARVHFMYLGPKIFGMRQSFSSVGVESALIPFSTFSIQYAWNAPGVIKQSEKL